MSLSLLSGNTGQYVDRVVDLLAFDNMDPVQETRLVQALIMPGGSGAMITGVQKLAHRFLIELLTVEGTLQYLPDRGCSFMADANSGVWRVPADVQASFAAALFTIRQNLQAEEDIEDPDEERFDDAELLNVRIGGGEASIQVRIVSLAGDEVEVILPIRVNVVR